MKRRPVVAKFEVEDDEHTLQDEELAEAFLDAGDFSWQAVEELLDGLWLSDIVVPNRRKGAFEPKLLYLGARGGDVSSWRSGWCYELGSEATRSYQVACGGNEASSTGPGYLFYAVAQRPSSSLPSSSCWRVCARSRRGGSR